MKIIKPNIGRLKRGLRQLWYRDIWHLWPSGPMNWRFLLPAQSDAVRLHRQLWWHARFKLPGLLWLPLECVRWLHWRLWAGPRRLSTALASYGPEVESRFGISVDEQSRQLGYWAKTWCIDPYTGYNWQLYRSDADGLAIIYDIQTSAYHALQNRKTDAVKKYHRLLGDKIALAERLSARAIPMVETVRISRGDWRDIETVLLSGSKLFCKLRSGNQGESAFAVWTGDNGLHGQALDGTDLSDEQAVRKAWQTLSGKGEVLIQPFLVNHPALAAALADDAVITLRVVTRVVQGSISAWWAELQVPGEVSPAGGRGSWRIAVSVADGAVTAMNKEGFLKQAWQDEYDTLLLRFSAVKAVPYWDQIHNYSLNAHEAIPKLWAIAWDWVITKDGPVLLEGNGGWGLEQAQQQGVELVSEALQSPQGTQ